MDEPLAESLRIQFAAAELGFDWRETSELWHKLAEEIAELKQAVNEGPERVRDELGDLLFMAVNLARHLRVDPVQALREANSKFDFRFGHILKNLDQLPALGHPQRLNAMEALWQEAKRMERAQGRSS
ncbi:MAG: MazG nucleotide pyrophosphohydrolase domain-containing protein [Stenotrophobium sp.]